MKFKYALLDMDGTLIDSMELWNGVAARFLAKYNIIPDPSIVDELKYLTLNTSPGLFKKKYNLEIDEEQIYQELIVIVMQIYGNEMLPKPGAVNLIEYLYKNKIEMYIATANDREPTESALRCIGIYDKIKKIYICDEVGYNKRERIFFEKVLQDIGCEKDEIVLFEDALHSIETAKSMGIKIVAIEEKTFADERDEIERLADIYCESFDEIVLDGSLLK